MKVIKIHKILEFTQSKWLGLKLYIDFNMAKRQVATSPFQKDLFKLNNSVYGRTLKNKRCHLDVGLRIVTTARRAKRYIAHPAVNSFNIINKDVTIIKLTKSNIFLSKPVYVGMSILDISKL